MINNLFDQHFNYLYKYIKQGFWNAVERGAHQTDYSTQILRRRFHTLPRYYLSDYADNQADHWHGVLVHRDWSHLKKLSLSILFDIFQDGCKIDAITINMFVQLCWPNLKYLDLCASMLYLAYNNIGNKGAKLLSKSKLPLMERLNLGTLK